MPARLTSANTYLRLRIRRTRTNQSGWTAGRHPTCLVGCQLNRQRLAKACFSEVYQESSPHGDFTDKGQGGSPQDLQLAQIDKKRVLRFLRIQSAYGCGQEAGDFCLSVGGLFGSPPTTQTRATEKERLAGDLQIRAIHPRSEDSSNAEGCQSANHTRQL